MRPLTERLSPTIRNLVIAQAAVYAFYVMVRPLRTAIESHLALGPRLFAGEVWQLITVLFVHIDPLGFLMSIIGLWFVGATIERLLGRRRFMLLFFATGLAANLVIAGLMALSPSAQLLGPSLYNAGCGDSVLALFVALGVVYGRAPIRVWGSLAMQARVLTWIILGWAVLALLLQGAWVYLVATLISQGVAYLLAGGRIGIVSEFLAGVRGKPRTKLDVYDGGRSKGRGKKYVN
jgi:membrane associated rhomboid family serine protease